MFCQFKKLEFFRYARAEPVLCFWFVGALKAVSFALRPSRCGEFRAVGAVCARGALFSFRSHL